MERWCRRRIAVSAMQQHPLTRLCLDHLARRAQFAEATDVAPEGASYADIVSSLTEAERQMTERLAMRNGNSWVVRHWPRLRVELLFIRTF